MPSPKKIKLSRLQPLLEEQLQASLPLVVYREPGGRELLTLLQDDSRLSIMEGMDRPGFVFAPFHFISRQAVLLQADTYYRTPYKPGPPCEQTVSPRPDPEGREIHKELVAEAIRAIRGSELEKVVLARRFSVPFSGSATELFFHLCDTYPEALCYLWHHPETGTWLGASPEQLMAFDGEKGCTDALAGTLPAKGTAAPDWTGKEYREQQMVAQYIREKLREAGLEAEVGPTRNERAGSLWHLKTRIGFRAGTAQAAKLVTSLHPTPAVCGLPAGPAREYILKHENFDREFYAGYLGEVGLQAPGSFRLYVNLRCMQLRSGNAHVYVGGGITAESDPGLEWEEIQHKSLTVLRVLENSSQRLG
ncbi:chorismate-binding protein [Robiginitalea sp. SC105]|uniref:chorismate-binding protein n=1 Tax=Robiginitalea sp. SC105 TaxID=2762332 RepID=UPI001639EE12|nr:chorismate-binding protein [Robiginitalea sp. SC105]MBC2840712.1 chorismate-binding protein [Robiginitalea sp. SC105]